MDVLQVLKDDHRELRELLAAVEACRSKPQFYKLAEQVATGVKQHLTLEENYLYSELLDTLTGNPTFVAALRRHFSLFEMLDKLSKSLKRKTTSIETLKSHVTGIQELLLQHFDFEEEVLLPRLRKMMSTVDREDLGQVYLDAKTDSPVERAFVPNLLKIVENHKAIH